MHRSPPAPAARSGNPRRWWPIKDQGLRFAKHCASQRQPLPLAAAEPEAPLAHQCVVAVVQALDEARRLGSLAGRFDLVLGCSRGGDGDVLGDGGIEEKSVLAHHSEPLLPAGQALFDRRAIDQDSTLGGRIQAGEQIRNRTLARTTWPHQRQHLALGQGEGDLTQGRRKFRGILQAHTFKTNLLVQCVDWSTAQAAELLALGGKDRVEAFVAAAVIGKSVEVDGKDVDSAAELLQRQHKCNQAWQYPRTAAIQQEHTHRREQGNGKDRQKA